MIGPIRRPSQRVGHVALGAVVCAALALVLVSIATKPIYLGADSINNYAHVWYISQNLLHHSLPAHVQYLENGRALTFPYAFVPWMLAALLRPLLGDYAVTWTMLAGILLLLHVVYRTRLHRDRWLLLWFTLCPLFLGSILSFEMAYVWALVFAFLYVDALRRGRTWRALLWFVVAAGTHVLMMAPLLVGYNLLVAWRRPALRRRVLVLTALGLALLVPEIGYVAQTPEVTEGSPWILAGMTILTLILRALYFAWPFAIEWLDARRGRILQPAPAALLCILTGFYGLAVNGLHRPLDGYHGLWARATNDYEEYFQSGAFVPGAVYRVMEATNEEQGQYYFIERGAILGNEFFGESMGRLRWTEDRYERYLQRKEVDFVVLNHSYASGYFRRYATEKAVLSRLVDEGQARLAYQDPRGRFVVFDVRGVREAASRPAPPCRRRLAERPRLSGAPNGCRVFLG